MGRARALAVCIGVHVCVSFEAKKGGKLHSTPKTVKTQVNF